MINIVEINDCNDLTPLSDEWADLLNGENAKLPYITPEFLLPWFRFSIRDNQYCRVLVAREEGRLVGMLPLMEKRLAKLGVTCTVLGFPTSGSTPPFDVIAKSNSAAIIDAFVGHLSRLKNWNILSLKNIPAGSVTTGYIEGSCKRHGLLCNISDGMSTLYVPVSPNWDKFFSSMPRKLRANTRRNWRNAQELGEPKIICYPSDGIGFKEAIRMVMEVTSSSWKEFEESNPALLKFFEDLMQELDHQGSLILRFLLINGIPVAYHLERQYKNVLYCFHNAYNISYQRISPGQLLIANTLQWAHENGLEEVDFYGGADYLGRWTDCAKHFVDLQVIYPSLLSRIKAKLYVAIHNNRHNEAKRKTVARRERKKAECKTQSSRSDE